MLTRRAKIICTIGPASRTPERLRALALAGMDVARLNFSHGTHRDHSATIRNIRQLARELDRPVAILQDLQGPKIRTGTLKGNSVELQRGNSFTLTTETVEGDHDCISTTFEDLPCSVKPGDHILLSDGLLRLEVRQVEHARVNCTVVDGGILRSRSGINLPRVQFQIPALSEKDREDLAFGLEQGVDFVALSFVRRAADLAALREIMDAAGGQIPAVAKLEKPQAIENLDEILRAADGVMIARGDLGVEMPPEQVPFLQKDIIRQAAHFKVPVITATQMLESMTEHPRPTRAEASDVANAILDGTDAVMLSGETAIGQYPAETAQMMDRIVREAEKNIDFPSPPQQRRAVDRPAPFPDAVAQAACRAAAEISATAIIAFTQSGFTARLISKYRPSTPIIAFTFHPHIHCQLALYWGVTSKLIDFVDDAERLIENAESLLCGEGLIRPGDNLVLVAGTPLARPGTTNLMRLRRAGDPLV